MKLSSYRNRFKLRGVIRHAAVALGVILVIALLTLLYLQRYIVYTVDGAVFDFEQSLISHTQAPTPSIPVTTIDPTIIYDDPDETEQTPVVTDDGTLADMKQLNGIYVSYDELLNIQKLKQSLDGKSYNSLILEVKREHGGVLYPSNITETRNYREGDTEAVRQFIQEQLKLGKYLIARVCCFRDDLFALDNQSIGLPISGGALWTDSDYYYWLDPASEKAQNYIISMGKELRDLGFSEVLLEYFSFPTSGNTASIVYSSSGTKTEIITAAAQNVVTQLNDYGMRVSLTADTSACSSGVNTGAGYDMAVLTGVFDRIYVRLEAGSGVGSVTDGLVLASGGKIYMKNWLVFITGSNDTRFDDYGVVKLTKIE